MSKQRDLTDSYGRRVTSLRISLTDHCNFRCVYCMPPEGLAYLDKSRYLATDEISRLVAVTARYGVTSVRLTGGEPLLRPDVVEIVRRLKAIDGVSDLSITTNGSLLDRLAEPLRGAGLDRLNISLDSLDPDRFAEITRVRQYDRVRAGIDATLRAGFPLKLNVVVLAGMPDDEILDFARIAYDNDVDVRFLEFMPLCGTGWEGNRVYPIADVRRIVRRHFDLEEMPRRDRPAQTFALSGGKGRVGFIASLSEPFCDRCSRMRLTADGKIRPCLFSDYEVDLRGLLKQGAPDDQLIEAVRHAIWNKPWGNEFSENPFSSEEDAERRVAGGPNIRSIGG